MTGIFLGFLIGFMSLAKNGNKILRCTFFMSCTFAFCKLLKTLEFFICDLSMQAFGPVIAHVGRTGRSGMSSCMYFRRHDWSNLREKVRKSDSTRLQSLDSLDSFDSDWLDSTTVLYYYYWDVRETVFLTEYIWNSSICLDSTIMYQICLDNFIESLIFYSNRCETNRRIRTEPKYSIQKYSRNSVIIGISDQYLI